MSLIIATDPGPTVSGVVLLDGLAPIWSGHVTTSAMMKHCRDGFESLLVMLDRQALLGDLYDPPTFAIEVMGAMGQNVGQSIFQSCYLIGRYVEAMSKHMECIGVQRAQAKKHLGVYQNKEETRSADSLVRAALIERYGGEAKAFGTKLNPGPLNDITNHKWSALAIGVTVYDNPENPKWLTFPRL